ncbi:MAG: hypothetical protein ACPGZP_05515 [Panacagrimonas sp.]
MTPDKPSWLDRPENVKRIVIALYVVCGLLLVAELFVHKHVHFSFEAWFGFYAFFGFLAYCFIVNTATLLRRLLKRDEGYYGDD